jgi:squalene-hopene/tetraprenyl-beta-curcumene cyclase
MTVATPTAAETRANLRGALLAARTAEGHWEGELSSSALSTATALFTLALHDRATRSTQHAELVRRGIEWLLRSQNADGGWGDTTRSITNISTTALCWAALSVAGPDAAEAIARAERWHTHAAGSLKPDHLAAAISARYGKDRTFSVPILTMCALAGRLGEGRKAWRPVAQLPFELAACPHQWFKWLRLPVVSYALPALIAIGQVRHTLCPSANPLACGIRGLTRERTLRVLEEIQPEGGGFLEAAPLTSFVTMSLIAAGLERHPVVTRGVKFLVRSARPDGSWPIDTNLSTWLTTLSINALAAGPDLSALLPAQERARLLEWLLGQQYRVEHPYTRAAPGGWAWTDLPGGVPDADDTPGALLALRHLAPHDPRCLEAADAGVRWLLDLQNDDGGMPTFCRGWGALPFDRSGADLTAHAIQAWLAWEAELPPTTRSRIPAALERAVRYLARVERTDGSWVPLWFGNQHGEDDQNPTYGTARVLPALQALGSRLPVVEQRSRAVRWLLEAQAPDGGWGGDRGLEPSIEETALAIYALAGEPGAHAAVHRGVEWLVRATDGGRVLEPSPIGFYFARLWYYEQLYPLIFATAALERWSALPVLSRDPLAQHPELSGIVFHEDPSLPLTEEEWTEEFR